MESWQDNKLHSVTMNCLNQLWLILPARFKVLTLHYLFSAIFTMEMVTSIMLLINLTFMLLMLLPFQVVWLNKQCTTLLMRYKSLSKKRYSTEALLLTRTIQESLLSRPLLFINVTTLVAALMSFFLATFTALPSPKRKPSSLQMRLSTAKSTTATRSLTCIKNFKFTSRLPFIRIKSSSSTSSTSPACTKILEWVPPCFHREATPLPRHQPRTEATSPIIMILPSK